MSAADEAADQATLVIPAFNEKSRIAASLQAVAHWRRARPGGWDWEILLVDDGSTDGTAQVARGAAEAAGLPLELLSHERNRGKGAAIRTGVLAARGSPILITDADLSTPLTEWVKLAQRLPTHPVAIGSRAMDEDLVRRKQPFHRRLLGKTGNLLVRLFAVRGIRDTQCGFKLFRGDVARDLFRDARVNRFAYDMEILHLARAGASRSPKCRCSGSTHPIRGCPSFATRSRPCWDLLRIRWIHRRDATRPG